MSGRHKAFLTTRRRIARGHSRVLGPALLAVALLVVYLAAWRIDPAGSFDLHPTPDAPEYLAGAVALSTSGSYSIHLAGKCYPPRYPFGYSLTLAPIVMAGIEPVRVPFLVNGLMALLLIMLVFGFLWPGRPTEAGLATLLLATTPGFLILARSPISDLTGSFWVTAGVLSLLRYRDGGKLGWGASGALLLGLSVCCRHANSFFAPVAAVAWLLAGRQSGRPVLHGFVVGGAYLCGVAPLLVYQAMTFGDFLASGYALWVPEVGDFSNAFQIGNVPTNLRYLGRETLQVEWRTTVATLYGHGSYFGPAGVLLLGWCVVRGLRRRPARSFAIAVGAYPVVMLFYFFQDARFFAPLFPLASVFVAVEICAILATGRAWTRTLAVVLLAAHVVGVPGSQTVFGLPRYLTSGVVGESPRYALINHLCMEEAGLVLSMFSPPYAHALLGNPWVVAPARDDHEYRFNAATFHFSAQERRKSVHRTRSQGRPVYLIADEDLDGAIDMNPPPPGTAWSPLISAADGGGLARLVAR